jgi:hypothetical protein
MRFGIGRSHRYGSCPWRDGVPECEHQLGERDYGNATKSEELNCDHYYSFDGTMVVAGAIFIFPTDTHKRPRYHRPVVPSLRCNLHTCANESACTHLSSQNVSSLTYSCSLRKRTDSRLHTYPCEIWMAPLSHGRPVLRTSMRQDRLCLPRRMHQWQWQSQRIVLQCRWQCRQPSKGVSETAGASQ